MFKVAFHSNHIQLEIAINIDSAKSPGTMVTNKRECFVFSQPQNLKTSNKSTQYFFRASMMKVLTNLR